MCQSPLLGCILPLAPRKLSLTRNTPGALTNHIAEPVKGMLPKWFWSTRRQKALWFSCMMDKHSLAKKTWATWQPEPPVLQGLTPDIKNENTHPGACSCTQASPTPAPGSTCWDRCVSGPRTSQVPKACTTHFICQTTISHPSRKSPF